MKWFIFFLLCPFTFFEIQEILAVNGEPKTSVFSELVWHDSQGNSQIFVEMENTTLIVTLKIPRNAKANISESWSKDTLESLHLLHFDTEWREIGEFSEIKITYFFDPLFSGVSLIHLSPIIVKENGREIAKFTIPPFPVSFEFNGDFELLREPLVRTDTLYPIEVSRANALAFEKPNTPKETVEILHERSFPLIAVLFAIIMLASLPLLNRLAKKNKPIAKEESIQFKIFKILQELEINVAKSHLDPKTYHALNFHMRKYIRERFGINSPYLTTEEFLQQTDSLNLENSEIIKDFLKESDRVKFKGKEVTLQDLDRSLKLVHKLLSI